MMMMVNMLLGRNRKAHILEEVRRSRMKKSEGDVGPASLGQLLGHSRRTSLDVRKGEKE